MSSSRGGDAGSSCGDASSRSLARWWWVDSASGDGGGTLGRQPVKMSGTIERGRQVRRRRHGSSHLCEGTTSAAASLLKFIRARRWQHGGEREKTTATPHTARPASKERCFSRQGERRWRAM